MGFFINITFIQQAKYLTLNLKVALDFFFYNSTPVCKSI